MLKLFLLFWVAGLFTVAYANEPLRIAVSKSPLSSAFFVADALDLYQKNGIVVEHQLVNGGHRAMQTMLQGDAEFATCSDMVITSAARKGKDFRVLTTFVNSSEDMAIVARKSSGIDRPTDLEDQKLGVTYGTSSHYYADTFLAFSGLDREQVQYVAVEPEQMSDALTTGKVDAASTWEPWITRASQILSTDAKVIRDVHAYTLSFNLVVRPGTVTPAKVRQLLKVLHQANVYIHKNPEAAKKIVAERLRLDQEYLRSVWENYAFDLRLDQSLLVTLESEFKWLNANEEISPDLINFLDYFDLRPMRQLHPENVTILK